MQVKLIKKPCGDNFTHFYIQYTPPLEIPGRLPLSLEPLNLKMFTNPKYPFQVTANKEIEEIANKVYASRMLMIARREYLYQTVKDYRNIDFLKYFEDNGDYRGFKYVGARKAFSSFMKGKCRIKDINIALFDKYKKFLSTYKATRKKTIISHNTACAYFSVLLTMLSLAYKDNLINKDYSMLVSKMTWDHDVKKDYLTETELNIIEKTDFPKEREVKQAFLLSSYTGLRRSDILNLKWENLKMDKSSEPYLDIIVHKTGKRLCVPLSRHAVKLLTECGMKQHSPENKVFPTLTEAILNQRVPELIKAAGINKHITMHCGRHTFAMMLLNRGVDIYKISKLLGHAQINNTSVYAKLNSNDLKECLTRMLDDDENKE